MLLTCCRELQELCGEEDTQLCFSDEDDSDEEAGF